MNLGQNPQILLFFFERVPKIKPKQMNFDTYLVIMIYDGDGLCWRMGMNRLN